MKGIYFEGKNNLVLRDDLPNPTIEKDEVLIKVKYCGICGSDIESFETGVLETPGIIIGHEFSGEIVEVGDDVRGWDIGDRVAANPALPCGKCYWCMHDQENLCKWTSAIGTTFNGAMAEYINVRSTRLFKLPDNVSTEEGALLEPLAVAVYAVQDSNLTIGQTCTVIGAGSIGLLTIQVLSAAGAREIYVIEPVQSKQQLALNFGAKKVFPPNKWSRINRLTKKIGPDHIYDCVGLPETFINSLKLIKRGGIITLVGIHAESFEMKGFLSMMLKNITMKGVYGYLNETFTTALNLVEKNKIDLKSMITRKIPLNQAVSVFKKLVDNKHKDIKVLVEI